MQGRHHAHLIHEQTGGQVGLSDLGLRDILEAPSFSFWCVIPLLVRLDWTLGTRGSSCFIFVCAKALWLLKRKELDVFQMLSHLPSL